MAADKSMVRHYLRGDAHVYKIHDKGSILW